MKLWSFKDVILAAILGGNLLLFCVPFPARAESRTPVCHSIVQAIENGVATTTRSTARSCIPGEANVVAWERLKKEPWRLLGGLAVIEDGFYPPVQVRANFSDDGPDVKAVKFEGVWMRGEDEALPDVRDMKTAGVRKVEMAGMGKLLMEGDRVIAGSFTLERSAELDLWRAVNDGVSLKDTVSAAWAIAP